MEKILPPLNSGERYLARHVVFRGRDRGLCTVALDTPGRAAVEPFVRETPGTAFVDGSIVVTEKPDCVILTNIS